MPLATLDEVKAALGISGTAEDTRLTLLLAAAEAQIARETGLTFTAAEQVEDHFGGTGTLGLRARPVVSVTSVVDLVSGATLDSSGYSLITRLGLLRRVPFGLMWDGTTPAGVFVDQLGSGHSVVQPRWRVTFQAGYLTAPADLKGALFEMVAVARTSQGSKTSEKEGDYAVSYSATPIGGISASARAVIDSYRVVL